MPGAAEYISLSPHGLLSGLGRTGRSLKTAKAEVRSLGRASIPQRVVGPLNVEDTDGDAFCLDDLALARPDLPGRPHDVFRHGCSLPSVRGHTTPAHCVRRDADAA